MSLTGHLKTKESLVGNCIKQVLFSNTKKVLKQAKAEPASLLFVAPPQKPYPYGLAGMAFDYRLRFFLERTPLESLIAHKASRALSEIGFSRPVQTPDFINLFWLSLEKFLDTTMPVRRQLDEDNEQRLARYCLVMAKFEEFYRTKNVDPVLTDTKFQNVEELLNLMPSVVVGDLCQLAKEFHDNGLQYFGPDERLILNPTFAGSQDVGGADADLIVGTCLVDIKTTIDPAIKSDYLHQLLGYVLLDYNDKYAIDEVAVFSARYCKMHRWNIVELIQELSGDSEMSIAKAKNTFRIAITNEQIRQDELF